MLPAAYFLTGTSGSQPIKHCTLRTSLKGDINRTCGLQIEKYLRNIDALIMHTALSINRAFGLDASASTGASNDHAGP